MIGTEDVRGVRVVRIRRPDKANSLTLEMLRTLADCVEDAAEAGCRAFVITGEGRVFSAGADLNDAREGLATDPVWERLSGAIAALPFLSIAALNGTVAGGALGMVLACDLRISVPQATFFYPVMRLGLLPQPSDVGRLAALVGPARAKMILLAGTRIGASDAREWGLVDRIVEADELMDVAYELAADCLGATKEHGQALKAFFR